jgi:hypothetical protein
MDAYEPSPQQKRNFWIGIGIMVVGAAVCCLLVIYL